MVSLLEVGTGFHPELTGRENVYLNGAILGMKKSQVQKKLEEIIAFSEIEGFIDTPVKRYSSGMYVRLAFAVAAHLDSDILLADEVLAVGDIIFQNKCIAKMNSLNADEGKTILFVSHNMAAIKDLCEKGILLNRGLHCSRWPPFSEVIPQYIGRGAAQQENRYLYREEKEVFIESAHWGTKEDAWTLFTNDRPMSIFIDVKSKVKKRISLEVVLRDAQMREIGFCALGLGKKIEHELAIGNNSYRVDLLLPILAIGRYYLDLNVAITGKAILDHCPSAVFFDVH